MSFQLADFVKTCVDTNSFSYDLLSLSHQFTHVPVFMYGCEKEGFSEDYFMCAPVIGPGVTTASTFALYKDKNDTPVVLSHPFDKDAARISGDLYLVTIQKLIHLDHRFNNGLFFRRCARQVKYFPAEQKNLLKKDFYTAEAFMYTGVQDYWKGRKDLIPCTINYPSQDAPYYKYRKGDDMPNRERIKQHRRNAL